MKYIYILLVVLALGVLACGSGEPREKLNLYPTVELPPTQTPFILTQTPNATYTPVYVAVTSTPNALCSKANEAVYLRPSPNAVNYPIIEIPNGKRVYDLGGRDGDWYFVRYENYEGWINGEYLNDC